MIAIVNVSPEDAPNTGINQYEVRINQRAITQFEHYRQKTGLAQCLRDAADAVEQQVTDEQAEAIMKMMGINTEESDLEKLTKQKVSILEVDGYKKTGCTLTKGKKMAVVDKGRVKHFESREELFFFHELLSKALEMVADGCTITEMILNGDDGEVFAVTAHEVTRIK